VLCGSKLEIATHNIWQCCYTRKVWSLSCVSAVIKEVRGESNLDLRWDLSQRDSEEDFKLIASFAWFLWPQRNRAWASNAIMLPSVLVCRAAAYLEEYQLVQQVHNRAPACPQIRPACWAPPRSNWFKVNMDGAVLNDHQRICIGDERGQFVATMSSLESMGSNAEDAEALAAARAVSFAASFCPYDVIFEGDLNLIKALRDASLDSSRLGHIVEFGRQVASALRSFEFSFIPRSGNIMAHLLARHAKGLSSSSYWLEESPVFLCNALKFNVMPAVF
jgi:hypothetical protein